MFEQKEIKNNFDRLCYNIKYNFYKKSGNHVFSKYFLDIKANKVIFFNRLFMARIFYDKKNNLNNFKYSIINIKNKFSKASLLNIIKAMEEVLHISLNLEFIISTKEELNRASKLLDENEKFDLTKEYNDLEKCNDISSMCFDFINDYLNFKDIYLFTEDNKIKNLYEKYISFYGELSIFNDDNYRYIYETKDDDNSIKEYEKWNQYIKEEYKSNGLKILHKALDDIDNIIENKKSKKKKDENNKSKDEIYYEKYYRKSFYDMIFKILEQKIVSYKRANKKDINFINSIIKLILSEGSRNYIFKLYDDSLQIGERNMTFINILKKIINNNIVHIDKLENDLEIEYVNSLIVLLESFGEYKNNYFLQFMFKINNGKSAFDILTEQFSKIKFDINFKDSDKNKLILFNSLSNCLNEYNENPNIKINYIGDKQENAKKYSKLLDDCKLIKKISNNENLQLFLFQIENILLYYFYSTKKLDSDKVSKDPNLKFINEELCFVIILCMNIFFKKLLSLLKLKISFNEESKNITFNNIENSTISNDDGKVKYNTNINYIDKDESHFEISQAVNELCNRYKNDEFGKSSNKVIKELLNLIFISYKILFSLNESGTAFEVLLYINDDIHKFKKSEKILNNFSFRKQIRLMILFSFLQEIRDIIEVNIKEKKNNKEEIIKDVRIVNFLTYEFLNLPEHSIYYFENKIDYSERETKIMSIYNFIECFIYDIKMNKKSLESKTTLQKILKFLNEYVFIYHILEIINICIFLLYNILLTKFYMKSRSLIEEEYNQIDNSDFFYSIFVIKIIHIIFLIVVIVHWGIFRAKIEYFYSKTELINENYKEKEKLKMGKKAEILKKKDYNLNEFFIKENDRKINMKTYIRNNHCIKVFQKFFNFLSDIYVNKIKLLFYLLNTIYTILLSLIFLCLSFWSQIFLIAPLFLIFNLFDSLKVIFLLILNKQFLTLILLLFYILLILYIFSWISFFFLPKMFNYEAVNKNNDIVSNNYESICSSSVPCILYFMNFGLSSEGSLEMNLISFKNNLSYYLIQFFYEIFLYLLIHMIFFNVVLATITNGYDKMKEKIDKKNYDEENVCFICDKTRTNCIEDNEDFDEHLERHNKWKYIIYMIKIIFKNKENYTNEEYNIWKQIKTKQLDWFPKYERKSEDSEKNISYEKKSNNNENIGEKKIIEQKKEINFENKKNIKINNKDESSKEKEIIDEFEVEKITDEEEELSDEKKEENEDEN